MSETLHSSIVVMDVENSSALGNHEKPIVRSDLRRLTEDALDRAGITPDARTIEDRGDGIYLLISAGVPKRRLFATFLPAVDESLAARRVADLPLRLRVAVAAGEVTPDEQGSSGIDVDRAFGMADHQTARDALAADRRARMVVVVSESLYESVITAQSALDPTRFRHYRLPLKQAEVGVWIHLSGVAQQPRMPKRESTPVPAAAQQSPLGISQSVAGRDHIGRDSIAPGRDYVRGGRVHNGGSA
ncbi:hypothetical protein [Catenuloplanes atrovinosus]|uniref:Uncharacterized protein n=1 Tax=Catenuloplanes atrovinosus TaxID=137266 RepID=A0AAE4CAY1_9ACTN|nr:hypothetical protein [Catenuloplanes atrovinosus]MDR7277467.1 hypothetical protein [Catenuloplanes atrovinosus]